MIDIDAKKISNKKIRKLFNEMMDRDILNDKISKRLITHEIIGKRLLRCNRFERCRNQWKEKNRELKSFIEEDKQEAFDFLYKKRHHDEVYSFKLEDIKWCRFEKKYLYVKIEGHNEWGADCEYYSDPGYFDVYDINSKSKSKYKNEVPIDHVELKYRDTYTYDFNERICDDVKSTLNKLDDIIDTCLLPDLTNIIYDYLKIRY